MLRYRAYGGERHTSGTQITDRLHTDQQWESTVKLYDYGARYYDPYLNRWIQPDTIVPSPGNPQALNRYSYSNNNPINYVDPSGHRPAGACEEGESCGNERRTAADTRNLIHWLVGTANYLATLPEGVMLQALRYLPIPAPGNFAAAQAYFYPMVSDGAPLDYKDKTQGLLGSTIQLGGDMWFEYSTPGNIKVDGFVKTRIGLLPSWASSCSLKLT